jgi:hypothetical protein
VWPEAKFLGYFEWFYRTTGSDVGYGEAEPVSPDTACRVHTYNAPIVMDLALSDRALCPTHWQAQQFPQLWQGHNWVVPLDQVVVLNRAIVTQPPPVSQKQSPEASAHLSEQPDHPGVDGYVLRLFVSGHGSQTEQSLKELHQFLKQGLAAPYSLKVIDICRYPELAEQDQITAVPTLVRIWPKPVRRIVGHLHHRDQLMQLLQPNTLVLGERSGRSLG